MWEMRTKILNKVKMTIVDCKLTPVSLAPLVNLIVKRPRDLKSLRYWCIDYDGDSISVMGSELELAWSLQ